MESMLIYCAGSTPAFRHCAASLEDAGMAMIDHPSPEVTHLLLDVPSFRSDGMLRSGQPLEPLLSMLPPEITVVGGNLGHSALDGYKTMDLLQDPEYLARNAAITAECALRVAAPHMPMTLAGCPVLIIGWGRIGKCLGRLLKALGANVTVAARKASDRAMLLALGYIPADTEALKTLLPNYRLLFNTAPYPILSAADLSAFPDCVKIELASKPGLQGRDVIQAKGLPGVYAPESSGKLIAGTFFRLAGEEGT